MLRDESSRQKIRTPMIKACFFTILFTTAFIVGLMGLPMRVQADPVESTVPDIHWTYQDITGPDYWADLDPAFGICKSGKGQSPVNLTAAKGTDMVNPDFHYEPVPLNILNNSHTVQVPYAPGSYITLQGTQYNLLQFHFHSPSEHAVENQSWDAELHLVHQSDEGELAVVAVLLQADEERFVNGFELLSKSLPTKAGDTVRTGKTINAQNLLPSQTTTYRYSGSLTTPPCSEAVIWLVMTEPVSLPADQIAQYQMLLNHNNRPLQQLNERAMQMDISP